MRRTARSFRFPDLDRRIDLPERMDCPSADPDRLIRTVRQFRLINLLLGRCRTLIRNRFIRRMRREPLRVWRVLDIGAGGCDLARWMARACRRRGLRVRITCLDHDPRIVAYARRACRGYPEIRVVHGSAQALGRLPEFDFAFSNNFLHHLSDRDLAPVVRQILARCGQAVLLIDQRRSRVAFFAFSLFARAFLHRSYALADGRLSIRRAFRPEELGGLRLPADRSPGPGAGCGPAGRPFRLKVFLKAPFRLGLYASRLPAPPAAS